MWVSKRKWQALEKKVADLENRVQSQQIMITVLREFCQSVANKEKLSLFSYQQLYSSSADGSKNVRMLFQQIRKFGQL